MKSLDESIANAMDFENADIVRYIPYILQDFFEIGSSADSIVKIIQDTVGNKKVNVLDLGCGKGAVTIGIAETINSACLGIDGVQDFIDYARKILQKKGLRNCEFKCADIREEIKTLKKYDIIILGSIGPVFGNYYETMLNLAPILQEKGIIILDDGYLEEDQKKDHELTGSKKDLFAQIEQSGMTIINEYVGKQISDSEQYEKQFLDIKKRCNELSKVYQDKKRLFNAYVTRQKLEYENLETRIVCSTMVIQRRT